jgi:hypothetical protein
MVKSKNCLVSCGQTMGKQGNPLQPLFPITPLPSTTEKTMELLLIAQKYQMNSVLCHIQGTITQQDLPFICPKMALHIYFLAQEHELHCS